MSNAAPNVAPFTDNFAYEPVSSRERAFAFFLAGSLIVANALLSPFSRLHLPIVAAFLPIVETAAFIGLVLTCTMLYSQYRVGAHAPLAFLACAFGAFGALQVPYLLTFPGVFSASGLLGAGSQSAAWLYVASRIAFAALVGSYSFFGRRERRKPHQSESYVTPAIAATIACVIGVTAFAILGQGLLPPLVTAHGYTPLFQRIVVPIVLASLTCCLTALLWTSRLRTRVQVVLAIILLATILDVCVAAVFSGGRYTLGWYLGRCDFAIATTLFIVFMHVQLTSILKRSAQSGLRAHSAYIFISHGHKNIAESNENMLAFAKEDLGFEWAFLARVEREKFVVESKVGDHVMLHAPDRAPEIALLKATLISNELAVQNGDARRSSGTGGATWATFAAMPVVVADVPYGVIVLGSAKRRARPLNAADRNFVRLIGALAGSNIERASQHRRLDELAFSDTLTGLPNRLLLLDRLQHTIVAAKRYGKSFNVFFLDVDYFKSINDRFGHAAGDEVLREVSRRLAGLVRASDTVARYGGDEFVVLAPDVGDEAAAIATRIGKAFEEPIAFAGGSLVVAVSAGSSSFPADGTNADALLRRADEALYRVKARRAALLPSLAAESAASPRSSLKHRQIELALPSALDG